MEIGRGKSQQHCVAARNRSRGFTLVELLCAGVVLTVGMVALLGFFAHAITSLQFSNEELIAKQKAREALEAIYSARSTGQLTFDGIQNKSQGGVFKDGLQPVKQAGSNGLYGTDQDSAEYDYVLKPGSDGNLDTATKQYLTNLQREIKFEPVYLDEKKTVVSQHLRKVTVTVQYQAGSAKRSISVLGMISDSH